MTEQPLDAERVAALLDGRLNAEERARVLGQLAADPEWREIAIDAGIASADLQLAPAAIAAPAAASPRADADPRAAGSRSTFRRTIPWIALAAAASVAVFVFRKPPTDEPRSVASVSPASARQFAMRSEDLGTLTRDRWATLRSGSTTLERVALSVRLGALAVDASLDQDGKGAEATAEMVDLMQSLPVAGAATGLLRQAVDSATQAQAFSATRALVDTTAFDAGVWLELIRAGGVSAISDSLATTLLSTVAQSMSASGDRAATIDTAIARLERELKAGRSPAAREAASELLRLLAS